MASEKGIANQQILRNNCETRRKRVSCRLNVPSQQVSTSSAAGAGGDGRLPVALVDKDGSEVSNDVDDTEHETISGDHGQVRSIFVSGDGTAGVLAGLEERDTVLGENGLALFLGEADGLVEEIVDLVTRVDLDVNEEDHCDQNGEDDNRVDVTGQESSLETTGGSVENDTPGNQKGRKTVVHSRKGLNGGSATQQKHGGHDDVGSEAEEEEGHVGVAAPTSVDNLGDGVRGRRNLLERNGENAKKENLDGGTRGVPEEEISRETTIASQ